MKLLLVEEVNFAFTQQYLEYLEENWTHKIHLKVALNVYIDSKKALLLT